jgi:cell division protein ZapA (FtsZ GTPase activity inhibitor)
MNPEELRTSEFSVAGEVFRVRTDLDSEKLQHIAQFVDEKLRMHITPGSRGDNRKKILLATMEIAGELIEMKEKLKDLEALHRDVENRTKAMIETISLTDLD